MAPKNDRKNTSTLKKSIANKKLVKTRKHSKKRRESFSRYIYFVLKQIYKDEIGISARSMVIMNDFVWNIFETIAAEASLMVKKNNKKTLTEREIHYATKLLIPKALGTHAQNEGFKAVLSYGNYGSQDPGSIPESE